MPYHVCQECGTKRKYPADRAGKKITCSSCGTSTTLDAEDDNDDLEDDGPAKAPRSRRRVTSKTKSRRKPINVGPIVLRIMGILAGIHGISMILASSPVLMLIGLTGFLGMVIVFVLCALAIMGIKGAFGMGISLSREKRLEGNAGIVVGIAIVEILWFICFLITQASQQNLPPKPETQFIPPQSTSVPANTVPASTVPATGDTSPSSPSGSASSNPTAQAFDERRRYVMDSLGFSFIPPPDMTEKVVGNQDEGLMGTASNGSRISMKVATDPFVGPLELYVQKMTAELPRHYPNIKVLQQSTIVTSDGVRAIKVVSDMPSNGTTVRLYQYLFDQGPRKMSISVGAVVEVAPQLDSVFDTSIKTVKFSSAANPSAPSQPPAITSPNRKPKPATPAVAPARSMQLNMRVIGFTGTGDLSAVAKQALLANTAIDQESIQYDESTETLTMQAPGGVDTKGVSEALEQAGIKTKGVGVKFLSK